MSGFNTVLFICTHTTVLLNALTSLIVVIMMMNTKEEEEVEEDYFVSALSHLNMEIQKQ